MRLMARGHVSNLELLTKALGRALPNIQNQEFCGSWDRLPESDILVLKNLPLRDVIYSYRTDKETNVVAVDRTGTRWLRIGESK